MRRDPGVGVFLLSWLAATAGCSIIAVTPPTPSQKPRVDVACTVDGYAPAIDLSTSSGAILGVLTDYSNFSEHKALVFLTGAAYLASGIYGLHTIHKCTKAKNAGYAYHARLLAPEAEPPALTTPGASSRPRPSPDDAEDEPEVKMKPSTAPRPPPIEGNPE